MSKTLYVGEVSYGGVTPSMLRARMASDLADPDRSYLAQLFLRINRKVFGGGVMYPRDGVRWMTREECVCTPFRMIGGLCTISESASPGGRLPVPLLIQINPTVRRTDMILEIGHMVHEMVHAYGYRNHCARFWNALKTWSRAEEYLAIHQAKARELIARNAEYAAGGSLAA